jgi:acyl-homoserine lactone synthase
MVHVVTERNAGEYARELDDMFCLRHEIFIKGRGWKLPDINGRERDQFDRPDTVYLLDLDNRGRVAASMRMLPTERPHLMSEVLYDLCEDGPPTGPTIWESSRGSVRPDTKGDLGWPRLQLAMIEFSLLWGIESVVFVLDTWMFPGALRVGWDLRPLGPPVEMDGESYMAGQLFITPETLKLLRMRLGIMQPVLSSLGGRARAA